jgi:hypothetical protein
LSRTNQEVQKFEVHNSEINANIYEIPDFFWDSSKAERKNAAWEKLIEILLSEPISQIFLVYDGSYGSETINYHN